jgi:histidine ammonia-lyase
MSVNLTGNDLSLEQLYEVSLDGAEALLASEARTRMSASRAVIERIVSAETTAYGVNTGFGELSEAETRAMLLLRANALAKGLSGVRPAVVEVLCAMLKHRVHPVIPSQGSVGASGDLAPLAHLAQVVIGEGEAVWKGQRMPGGEALRKAGIAPLVLEAKEGISLLNGTQGMLALLSLALRESQILADTADVAAALALDALRGSPAAFDPRIAAARPYPGHTTTSRNLLRLNRGSQIRESHRPTDRDPRVQDAYSLRCTPQVHGAVRDALTAVRAIAQIELNSATDNPLVFVALDGPTGAGDVISGGNFHGQPLAMAADQLAVALATLGGISERRIEHMTNPHTSLLPAFLTNAPGLNSGFMIAQVTAAALASENKTLAAPHSVDSIPTSGGQEDYVSMGMSAARRLRPMLDNLRRILAIELLAACQGIDFLAPLRTGSEALKAHALVRNISAHVQADRSLAADIEAVAVRIAENAFADLLR